MFPLDILSHDPAFLHAIREQITKGAWDGTEEVSEFSGLADVLDVWKQRPAGVLIVDTAALDGGAKRFAEWIETMKKQVVLFLVGETTENTGGPNALEMFAKPVRLGALLARWQFYRALRQKQNNVTLALGPWELNLHLREAQRPDTGERVRLTEKETCLLEYLYQAQEPLPREEILEAVWGYDGSVDTHTLETHITGLRRKLEPSGEKSEGSFLLAERGRYRLNPAWVKT
jgi:DNA-binding response OmpR family regulator